MRNLRNPQLERSEFRSEDIKLNHKCRDDMLALLTGLLYLYSQEALRDRILALMDEFILPGVNKKRWDVRAWRCGAFWCVRLTDASAAGVSPAERKGSHHFHREPCAGHREVSGEASVAACTGRAIEPRKS